MGGSGAGRLRIGVVGAGRLAERVWFDVLAAMPGVEVAGVADPVEHRRRLASARFPAIVTAPRVAELLAAVRLDAVLICSPPEDHAASTMCALDAGLHVYVEKPLARSVDEALALVERARSTRCTTMVGLNYRHHPALGRLRAALAAGRIGAPVAMQSIFSVAQSGSRSSTSPGAAGGALTELGTHHADLARFLLASEVREVSATVRSRRAEGDSAVLALRLETGVVASTVLATGASDEDRLMILGEEGTASFDRLRRTLSFTPREFRYGRGHAIRREGRLAMAAAAAAAARPGEPSYWRALKAFVEAVRTGRPGEPGFTDGLRAVEAVDAAVRSAASGGRPVPLQGIASGAEIR